MKLPHAWSKATPLFDDEQSGVVRGAGPGDGVGRAGRALGAGRRAGHGGLAVAPRVASAGVNPAGKLTSIIAGMAAGADSIDDLQVIRSGGMKRLFGEVYAPATLGQFLREFTHGHASQLASVARAHLVNLAERTELLPGIEQQAYRRHRLAAAAGLRARQAGRQLRAHQDRRASRCSARACRRWRPRSAPATAAPVVAGIRLRAGKAGSGKGAASMVREAIKTARAAGATGEILVRGDSAYGNSAGGRRLPARPRCGSRWCWPRTPPSSGAIDAIPEDAWTPVHYPGAVVDPDTGELISDAEVAETTFTAFASTKHPVTARLVVRRVRDQAKLEELFPVWRHHPFFTNSDEPTVARRPHPPAARGHRDRVRRPDRRTPGAPALRPVRRQQRVGGLRDDHPQPAPRRRHPRPRPARPWPAAPRCAARSSTSPPGSPGHNAGPCCTCPRTGPGPTSGWRSGTACSATATGPPATA